MLPHRRQINLAEQAYQKIEEMLVCGVLQPGRYLATHELQVLTGFGRTPVLQAVNRLAADTLVQITPRHGIRISPIDLTRERRLLELRRDMERFVIRLASERSGASQRNRMQHMRRQLLAHASVMNIAEFNVIDKQVDQLILASANEPFVEGTLRPLHTVFRRIGWIYHMQTPAHARLDKTIEGHIAVIEAVAEGRTDDAIRASDNLMDFVDSMFDVMERDVPPGLLDFTFDDVAASQAPDRR